MYAPPTVTEPCWNTTISTTVILRSRCSIPAGHRIDDIKDPPFDYTLFVSKTGKRASVQFNMPDGQFDEEGLNQMVALNLFADVSSDSDGKKNAIRTDWYGHSGYRDIKPVKAGETGSMVRCMASFGLTAVWYPKYRIATGAACLVGEQLCQAWLKDQQENLLTKKAGKEFFSSILDEHIELLSSPPGERAVRNQFSDHLRNADNRLKRTDRSAKMFQNAVENYPRDGSFKSRFERGGEYFRLMEGQVSACRDAFKKDLWSELRNQINRIDFDCKHGMQDIRAFFSGVDHELKDLIKQCPSTATPMDLNKLDFGALRKVEEDIGLKFVGLRDKAIEQHQSHILKKLASMVESTYVSLRNYFLRPILEDLREELGIDVQAETDEIEEKKTILRAIEAIEGNLKSWERSFKDEFRSMVEVPKQINVVIVANNPEGRH